MEGGGSGKQEAKHSRLRGRSLDPGQHSNSISGPRPHTLAAWPGKKSPQPAATAVLQVYPCMSLQLESEPTANTQETSTPQIGGV